MPVKIELLDDETLGVSFPYERGTVASIKRLQNRRWNSRDSRWEVHLSHLAELLPLLGLKPGDVSEEIRGRFRRDWQRVSAAVELGPVHGRIAGSGLPLRAIDEATSFPIAGHQYSPRFKQGRWDGRKHLFDIRRGTFPTGLWSRVRGCLEAHGIQYTLAGAPRAEPGAPLACPGAPTPLREYQQRALERALAGGRGIIQIATGGGKTLLAAHLIRRIGRPAFFFVHTLDLLHQTRHVLERELGVEIGILGDGQANLRPVTVATIQTATRAFEGRAAPRRRRAAPDDEEARPEERELQVDEATRQQIRDALERAEVAIFDECHHVPAATFYTLAMRTGRAAWRFGLSATPWRDDDSDMLLEAALGERLAVVNCSELIEQGYLVAPRIHMTPVGGVRAAPGARVEYQEWYRRAIVENQQRNRVIAARARQWVADGRSVLVLVGQIAHGEILCQLLPEAQFIHGLLEGEARQRLLQQLERKLHPLLIATTLADEGLDVPSLDAVILAGGGKSPTRAYQRIGRALRPAAGKDEALIQDFLDEAPYLRQHSAARLALYRQEPAFRICMETRRP
ncbi:MAG TPA: DEAD/DEAH box helicase [Candidatus Sumerlaeota bacterium]|nr:DEAD/DEAH box helicase [Candidatus Sumerlaeota bacterium]